MAADLPQNYIVVRDNEVYFLGQWERDTSGNPIDLKLLKDTEGKPVAFSSYKEAATAANSKVNYKF